MILLESMNGLLLLLSVPKQTEHHSKEYDAQGHRLGVKEGDQEEYDDTGEEVIGLVVEQIIDDSVEPSLRVAEIRDLETGLGQDEVIHTPQRRNFHRAI